MNNYTDIILKYRLGEMTIAERDEFNRNLCTNIQLRKEFLFQEKLDKVMKKNLLLEAIESDPDLIKAEILARNDIENYLSDAGIKNSKKGINIFEVETEVELRKMIAKAEVEMVLSGIDNVSEVWVRDFEQNKPKIVRNQESQRIIEFVKKSDPFNESDEKKPSIIQMINRKIVYQVAAAVLVLSLLLFKSLTPSYSGDNVYKHYYEPLEANSFTIRSNSQNVNAKFREGVDFYLSKNYEKAEVAFNSLRKPNETMPEVSLYAGLNQMGKGNFPEAITLFSDLLSAEDQFVPEAQWYLGLCYIKTGENLKACSLMETLAENEGMYRKKAQLILKNLKR